MTAEMKRPGNIHCLALNYPGVGTQTEEPLYFVKSPSCYNPNPAKVVRPDSPLDFWTEVELGIVISEGGASINEISAEKHIAGYVVCADLTLDNICKRDHHLAYSKSRQLFCPVSPRVTTIETARLCECSLKTWVNDELTQQAKVSDMHFQPAKTVSYLSHIVTLEPGDLILTGTPAGVENNILSPGDKVRHMIDNIGELNFAVA